MKHLIALIQTKPQWLNNEGYWRILQILRFVAAAPPALIAIGVFLWWLLTLLIYSTSSMYRCG